MHRMNDEEFAKAVESQESDLVAIAKAERLYSATLEAKLNHASPWDQLCQVIERSPISLEDRAEAVGIATEKAKAEFPRSETHIRRLDGSKKLLNWMAKEYAKSHPEQQDVIGEVETQGNEAFEE